MRLRQFDNPKPIRRRWQQTREKSVTVCIAASCEDGRIIVSATDGQLTYGDITADVMSGKLFGLGNGN